MATNELMIGLVIGATLKGVHSAFSKVTKLSSNLNNQIDKAKTKQTRFGEVLSKGLQHPTRNIGILSQRYHQLNKAISLAEKSQLRLNKSIMFSEKLRESRQKLQGQMFETSAHAYAIGRPLLGSVKTFMEQEEAANDLKIVMMKADGTVGKYKEITEKVKRLGIDLPGTLKDFYNLSEALKKQGLSENVILNGGLETAAKLNVLLGMDQYSGGEFLAKLMEGHGLSENELFESADYLQRAMFAGGLNKEQMYESMKYYAPKLNSMKLTGSKNTEKIFAIEAMAGQQGLEGSTFGTGLNMMLSRMNKGPEMLKNAKKGMKAEARDMMESVGVEFEFWDKKGSFKGIDGMLAEMTKFEKIRKKYGDKGVGLVAEELFGIEGGRLADILAQKGSKGLDAMLVKMREQASLEARVAQKTRTLGAAFEALGGVWESAVGVFGSAFADDLKIFAKTAQSFIENTLTPWISENKGLIKTVAGGVLGLTGMKLGILALSYAFNLTLSPVIKLVGLGVKLNGIFNMLRLAKLTGDFSQLSLKLRLVHRAFSSIRNIGMSVVGILKGKFINGLSLAKNITVWFAKSAFSLGKILSGKLLLGLNLVGKGILFIGRALLMNPIGLLITGIGVAAFFIYKYWEPIKGFFLNLWTNLTNFFNSGIGNISATILNWSPLGLFYKAFAGVLNWFGVELPATFTGFGQNIIDGLVNGISNAWNTAKETVTNLGSGIKNWFAEKLEIHSPSRVFMGFGENTVQGLAIGVNNTLPLAENASNDMAESITPNISSPSLQQTYQEQQAQKQNQSINSGMVVNFNPTIEVKGNNSQEILNDVKTGLKMSLTEFERMLERVMDQKQRRAY